MDAEQHKATHESEESLVSFEEEFDAPVEK